MFVLIHSPSVGPSTWTPVAERLAAAGHDVVVPSLREVADAPPPFWPTVVDAVRAALPTGSGPLVLVAHSNAGFFLPMVRAGLDRPVRASVFVDAGLPAEAGQTPLAKAEFLGFLRGLAGEDGRLPRWTDWWGEDDIAPLFPDPQTREIVVGEQSRLPLAYYEQSIPVPAGWTDEPAAYLRFSPAYDAEFERARTLRWPVAELPGQHLHMLVDPAGTANLIRQLSESGTKRGTHVG